MRETIEDWPTGRLLSTAARLVEQRWNAELDAIGMSHAGLIVLHLLADGPLAAGELAARARVSAQTMSRTVDRLERDGHVRRVPDPADARRRTVERTPDGHRAFDAVWGIEARIFPDIEGAGALRQALLALIRAAEQPG